jgi:hypothetical protein
MNIYPPDKNNESQPVLQPNKFFYKVTQWGCDTHAELTKHKIG